jgi:signal peptidase II
MGCDQISKSIVRNNVGYYENIELISNYFTLTKVENSGAFLSLGDTLPAPIKMILLNILPLLALMAGIIFLILKSNLPRLSAIGLAFIIGGGMGNIYDRIMFGSVTDFLHMDFVIFQTGIFNMADVSIMVGMFMMFVQTVVKKDISFN